MQKYLIHLIFLIALGCTPLIHTAAVGTGKSVNEKNLILPKDFAQIFTLEGTQNGKRVGWLTVRSNGKTEGKVRVRLDGASFYNAQVPHDFKVTYWGHNSNGCYFDLPKGLYNWDKPVKGWIYHTVHPSLNASPRYALMPFDMDLNETAWSTQEGRNNKKIIWDPSKIKYAHPSKEINDVLEKAGK